MKKTIDCLRQASVSLALVFLLGSVVSHAQTGSDTQLVYQLQQLQDEVRELRGLVEQQSFELENLKRRQRDQYVDLDQRLTDRQQSGVALVGSSAATPAINQPQITSPVTGTTNSTVQTIGLDVPEVRETLADQRQVTSINTPTVGSSASVAVSPEVEKEAYDEAFSALKDLRYAESAQAFTDFISQYPTSDYADNAQYWLGESFYAASNYDLALNAFRSLMSDYPDSSKTADALLKIGYSHYEKKEWPQARAALEQVKVQYADSTLSRLAESRLRNMRLDGNY